MGAYCTRSFIPRHTAKVDEIMEVRWSDYHLLLPGQVLRYKRSLFILDRLELPCGTKVGLWHFVGFKLRLSPKVTLPPPAEDVIVKQAHNQAVHPAHAPGVTLPR